MNCDSNGQMQWGKITNDVEFRLIGNSGDGGIPNVLLQSGFEL